MNELEFSFEESPWDAYRLTKQMGDKISAAHLLAMLEEEDDQVLDDALEDIETGCMILDISDLPRVGGSGETSVRLRREMELVKNGLTPSALEESDPLRLYLEEVAQVPAFADTDTLAQRCASGDEAAMEALTALGLSRVVELACEPVGYGELLVDFIPEGSLGLWQAIRNYRCGNYADHRDRWIRLYMAKAVTLQARANGIGQKMRTALEDYRAVDERLLEEFGRNPTLEEIALELHMGVEEAASVRKMLEDARLLAQVKKEPDPDEETEAESQAVEDTAQFQSRARILDLLSGLNPLDTKLLTLRFGLESGIPLTPEQTGTQLGLTPEEVVKKEAAILAKLRNKQES